MSSIRGIWKRFLKRIWSKTWSPGEVKKYLGNLKGVYLSYAAKVEVRDGAASGGSVSAILIHLLEEGAIDGAVVLRNEIGDEGVRPRFILARSAEDILSARGSKYSAVRFTHDAFPLVKEFHGQVALVALPCDAKIIHEHRKRDSEFNRKVSLVITLFCGHNSLPLLTDRVVESLVPTGRTVRSFVYRSGHWRGRLKIRLENDREIDKPFSVFSDYQNLYFFSQRKCHYCFDHTGYFGDISAGDIWSPEMREHPVKHTALLSRTDMGEATIQSAFRKGALTGEPISPIDVLNGQARTLPFHYNITARAKVGRLFGERIKDPLNESVRWNEYLVAIIVMFNERVSRTRLGKALIFRIPRPLLRLYLYFLKGLESL